VVYATLLRDGESFFEIFITADGRSGIVDDQITQDIDGLVPVPGATIIPAAMQSKTRSYPIDELALRLAAAYISYVAGKVGVDRTPKEIRGEPAGEMWRKLALTLMEMMAAGPPSGSDPRGTIN